MTFTSFSFAAFFCIVAVAYFFVQWVQSKCSVEKNLMGQLLLFCASLVFYALNGWKFLPLLLCIAMVAYVAGRYSERHKRKALFLLQIACVVLPLACFKYPPHTSVK